MLQDDNKIIFDKPQNFYRDTTKIKNDVIRKVITVNDKIQYYACVTDITYSDGGITATLLGRDDEEYEVSITAEIGDDEVYPSYLAVDSTQPTYIQAVQIVILEGLRLLTDDDSTLPEAEEINELQATITQLEKDLSDAGDTITTLTGQLETAQEQIGTLTGQLEQAQSQTGTGGDRITSDNFLPEYGECFLSIPIINQETNTLTVGFAIVLDGMFITVTELGYSSQQGATIFKNTLDNSTLEFELYIDGTKETTTGGSTSSDKNIYVTANTTLTLGNVVTIKAIVKDADGETLDTATTTTTYYNYNTTTEEEETGT